VEDVETYGAAGAHLIDKVVSYVKFGPVVTNFNRGAAVGSVVAREVRGAVIKTLSIEVLHRRR